MRDANATPDDPHPCYPTAEEIALAERLLREIEERYLRKQDGRGEASQPLRKAA